MAYKGNELFVLYIGFKLYTQVKEVELGTPTDTYSDPN